MRTPITYYGGKQRLADTIIAMMPPHKLYCEPFFGGGAVFFRKPKTGLEVINDRDNALINFYHCAQNHFPELQDMVQQTLHSETMYRYAKDVWNERVPASDIEKAWAIWYITNGSTQGSMHGSWTWCNGLSGGHAASTLNHKRSDFSTQLHNRLKSVQISCRDAHRVILERDTPNTLFYLDPPYPGSFQGHYRGYTHKEFYELCDLLSSIRGKFILSCYWTQILRYHILKFGWNHKAIEVSMKVTNWRKSNGIQKRTEILAYNFDLEQNLFTI